MKFPKSIFEGDEQVKNAKDRISKIHSKEQKGRLSRSDRLKLSEALAITRRHKILALLKCALPMLALSGGIFLVTETPQSDTPESGHPLRLADNPTPIPHETNQTLPAAEIKSPAISEQAMDLVIQKLENGILNLEKRVTPKIESIPDEMLRLDLASPFVITEINASNPNKNRIRFLRQQSDAPENGNLYEQGDVNYFSYQFDGQLEQLGLAARFEPPTRTLRLSPDFDPNDAMHLLIAYHELKHVCNDTAIRRQLDSKEKFDQYIARNLVTVSKDQGPGFILNEEATAYSYEVEILNMMSNDTIRQEISTGSSPDIKALASTLNVRDIHSLEILVMLVDIAKAYYPEALANRQFSRRYISKIIKIHRGAKPFIVNSDGKIAPLNDSQLP